MGAQSRVQLAYLFCRKGSTLPADAIDSDRADLFGLSFRIARQAGPRSWQEDLERIDPFDIGRDWYDGDDTAAPHLPLQAVGADGLPRTRFPWGVPRCPRLFVSGRELARAQYCYGFVQGR